MTRFGPDHLLQGINDRAMIATDRSGLVSGTGGSRRNEVLDFIRCLVFSYCRGWLLIKYMHVAVTVACLPMLHVIYFTPQCAAFEIERNIRNCCMFIQKFEKIPIFSSCNLDVR